MIAIVRRRATAAAMVVAVAVGLIVVGTVAVFALSPSLQRQINGEGTTTTPLPTTTAPPTTQSGNSSTSPVSYPGQSATSPFEVQVTGAIFVPSESDDGTLLLTVNNGGTVPIVNITVGLASPPPNGTSTSTSGVLSMEMSNGAMSASSEGGSWYAVTPGFPFVMYEGNLPVGQEVTASGTILPVTAGDVYAFTVTLIFAGGGSQVQVVSIVAQI